MRKISLILMVWMFFFSASSIALYDIKTQNTIKESIQANFPQIKVDDVSLSVAGLYEVRAGSLVLYASSDGRYLFHGEVLDMENSKNNITEKSRKELRRELLEDFGSKYFITYKASKEVHSIIVFTDIGCGYCKLLHKDIPKLNSLGITVHYLSFPRSEESGKNFKDAESVWCAANQKISMEHAMEGIDINYLACSKIISTSKSFGLNISVEATPTILLEDGTLLPGYLKPEAMLAALEETKAAK